MSSKYTTTKWPVNGLSTWFINRMKVLGVLDSPNGITNHLYKPSFVLKVVSHSSLGLIRIWWYPLLKLIFEKILELASMSSISSNQGMGNRYLMVIFLMARLSMHIRQVPSFFGTNMAGTTQGLILSWLTPSLSVLPLVPVGQDLLSDSSDSVADLVG